MLETAGFMQARNQAKVAEMEGNLNAMQESARFTAEEADRKTALADAIASQRASAAGRGVSAFEGSPLAVIGETVRRSNVESERARFSSLADRAAGIYRARSRSENLKARSLLNFAKSIEQKAQGFPTKGTTSQQASAVLF